ncbi:MAG: glycosyltransferase [Bacteroidota bacterium]
MIWIASFPRSGNTYVRNILFEVYGLSSGEFHREKDHPLEESYFDHPFVKTHLLPHQLEPNDTNIKSIYLVRDGRDALVSIAHQRSDIVAPGSDYYENLKAAIFAEKDTFFGGWSHNVKSWVERADLIIRYEDLLTDPIGVVERIRTVYDLPSPDISKLPTFDNLKKGDAAYGGRKSWGYSDTASKNLSEKAFRKGISGGWQDEMPDELHDLFWSFHGNTMEALGYSRDGSLSLPDPDLDHLILKKMGTPSPAPNRKYHILLEANKMDTSDNDGVKRYLAGLIKGLIPITVNDKSKWEIDLLINKDIIPLQEYARKMEADFDTGSDTIKDDSSKSRPVNKKGFFEKIEQFIQELVPENWINWLTERDIMIFHKSYDLTKKYMLSFLNWIRGLLMFPVRMLYTVYLRYRQEQELRAISEKISHYDLIHIPLQQHYWPFKYTRVPLVFTIHDFTHKLFPKFHTGINIRNAAKGLKLIQKKQAHVIAVSNSTLQDSKKFLSLPEESLHLVYESVEEDKFLYQVNKEDSGKHRDKYGIRKDMPFILLLSTIEPRKNLHHSISAFLMLHKKHKGLNLSLVVAGKQGWKMKQHVRYSDLITFTGFIDDSDLSALYSEALALSYVSYYEGFGLPLLEAMRCGTPVIYGNNSSMPEVASDGGLGADPYSVEDICDKYEQMVFNNELRNDLGKKAMKQSLRFSTRKSTLEMLNVYESIIKST